MKDKEYAEHRLRAMIVPEQVRWPAPETVHWEHLHRAADEARGWVSATYTLMDEIDHDADLSQEGKARQRRKVALQAIADFEASKTLPRARNAVTRVIDQWNAKSDWW